MTGFYDILNKLIGVYCLLLVIFGTIMNILGFIVCARKRLRIFTTFIFVAFIFIADTFSLYLWCVDHFIEAFFGFVLEEKSKWICRIGTVLQQSSLEWSSWLLVGMTIDRYLSLRIKLWRTLYFKVNHALFIILIIGAFLFIANCQLYFSIGAIDKNKNIVCVRNNKAFDNWISTWQKIHTGLYSVIPFLILISINSILIIKTFQNSNSIDPISNTSNVMSNRKKHLSLVITVMTFFFILATIPSGLITGFFYEKLNTNSNEGNTIIFFCDSLAFTYHSSKLIILILFNKKFNQEFRKTALEVLAQSKNIKFSFNFSLTKSNSDFS